ncbi:MAG: hypothetical protein AAF846_12940 [Chloroflexota bacterium]
MSQHGKYAVQKKDPLRAFYPIIGLVIFAIAAAVGWFSSPFVLEFASAYIPVEALNSLTDIDPNMPLYVVAFMVFLLIIMVFSALYALFSPKQEKLVTEAVLKKERDEMEAERKRTKARKRRMRERMKAATKNIEDI